MRVVYTPKGAAREYGELAANLYEGGCPAGCLYCYIPSTLHMTRAAWLARPCQPRAGILEQLEKDVHNLSNRLAPDQIFLCFLSDPWPAGVDTTTTREAIKLIHRYGFGVKTLSKAGTRAVTDFDLFGSQDDFGVSLTLDNPRDSMWWESEAALPTDRIAALQVAYKEGIPTWASLEPVIEAAQTLRLIERSAPWVDHYAVGTWNHDSRVKLIDWPTFGQKAIELLEKLGKSYYIKADLRRRMEVRD